MNQIQLKLLELANSKNIWSMSLRTIAKEIEIRNASSVKYHLDLLISKGLLKQQPKSINLEQLREKIIQTQKSLINIPILGSANCGIATIISEELNDGYLKITSELLPTRNYDAYFAVRAEGNSMNRARINGQNIESGDYLIIDTNKVNPKNGDYILSVIDGLANIKKYVKDEERNILALISESTEDYPPIFIHEDADYLINGTVVAVAKNPVSSNYNYL